MIYLQGMVMHCLCFNDLNYIRLFTVEMILLFTLHDSDYVFVYMYEQILECDNVHLFSVPVSIYIYMVHL